MLGDLVEHILSFVEIDGDKVNRIGGVEDFTRAVLFLRRNECCLRVVEKLTATGMHTFNARLSIFIVGPQTAEEVLVTNIECRAAKAFFYAFNECRLLGSSSAELS